MTNAPKNRPVENSPILDKPPIKDDLDDRQIKNNTDASHHQIEQVLNDRPSTRTSAIPDLEKRPPQRFKEEYLQVVKKARQHGLDLISYNEFSILQQRGEFDLGKYLWCRDSKLNDNRVNSPNSEDFIPVTFACVSDAPAGGKCVIHATSWYVDSTRPERGYRLVIKI